jgi:hypothetical protein
VGQTTYREVIVPKTKGPLVAALLLAGLALTGCTTAPAEAPTPSEAVSVTTESEAAPAQVAPDPTPTVDIDAEFLASSLVRQIDLDDTAKLSAAAYACEQVTAGNLSVVALEGVTEQMNRFFVGTAVAYYCPELSEVYTAG